MTLRTPALFALALASLACHARVCGAQRLPANAVPDHYSLRLAPDIAGASFTGLEVLDLTLTKPSKTITLNALELKIGAVTASGQTAAVSYDLANEQATFTFPHELAAGRQSVAMQFTGVLNDKLRGFYLSKSRTHTYAVTQFESTDARRAFPSFDEPALKATFDVALTVNAADTAISNSNVVSDVVAGAGKHTVTFARTPRMSTYLVAFLVGDFQCSTGAAEGVPIRVCASPDKLKLTTFALSAAEHFLAYYDNYFGIKYPMPKLDLIAIPDFEAGAMENFGAITYRETELLVDEKDGQVAAKKRVASVVAHEMAHQWFGDMVTMQWWDNLWLNEGFATWMQDKAADEWKPEWHFSQDVAAELDGTLNYDAARTTRTIRARAETPAEISQAFDGIAYGKAGAVIGMVEHYVGAEVFRQGVHDYLAAHLYGNASAEDFWSTQTITSRRPVDKIMSSFIDQPGVPLLTFGERTPTSIPVTQSRFFLGGSDGRHESPEHWTLPVCIRQASTAGALTGCSQITPATSSLPASSDPLFFANAGQKGYYRTAYTPSQTAAIAASAESDLTIEERIGFLGDRWALTRAGQSKVGEYLDLVLALKNDANPQLLESALGSLGSIRTRIATPEERKKLDAVIRSQFGPVWAKFSKSVKGASFEQQQMRAVLFGALGTSGDPLVNGEAQAITTELLTGKKIDDEDLVDISVALAAAKGDSDFYDRVQLVSEKADDPGLQTEALETLAQFHRPELVVRTLEYAVSGKVRNQDSWVLVAVELSQAETRDIAWAWTQKNWDKVKAQLTTASGAQLVGATGSFCTVRGKDEVRSFFAAHPVEASDRALAKALDAIDDCVHLREKQEPNLKAWLAKQPG